jgi:hypothetical protein
VAVVDIVSLYCVGGIMAIMFGPIIINTSAFQSQFMVMQLSYGFLTG